MTSKRRRPGRPSPMAMSATVLAVLLSCENSATTTSAFAPSATMAPIDNNLTTRNFRHVDENDISIPTTFSSTGSSDHGDDHDQQQEYRTTGPIESSVESHLPQQEQFANGEDFSISTLFSMSSAPLPYVSVNDEMPTWLRPKGDKAEIKLTNLRQFMTSSYLSQLEADSVISAIREASSGDLNKMAGAADFCLLLVETMEMGVDTLIAAAFHYCECFVARQKIAVSRIPPFKISEYWAQAAMQEEDHNERIIKFGNDAHQIAKAATRLKWMEMVAGQSLQSKPKAKDSENMRKMLLSETKDWRALALRSAGCLYRLRGIYRARESSEDGVVSPNDINVAHVALAIYAPLASRMGMHRLKNEIEGAAFRVLYRRQYEKVIDLTLQDTPCNVESGCIVSTLNEGMTIILNQVTEEVKTFLKKDPCFQKYAENVKVTARIKEPYSLWKKMLKLKASQVLDVPDTLALRVVLEGKKMANEDDAVTRARERALCYYALKKCTKAFEPRGDGRFKDYIQNPKANGYQSLHYTASTKFDGQEWPFEVQVRSGEMHQVAEFGLAAHWDYKEQGKTNNEVTDSSKGPHFAFHLDQSSDAYLRSVQNWHWNQSHGQSSWAMDTSFPDEKESGNVSQNEGHSEHLRARNERLAPYLKALMADQSNLTREQVFIFLQSQEDGITLALPAGSCVLDALRESQRTLGLTTDRNMEKKVEHNGCLTSVTQKLNNGDILTIPIATV
eukprot:CAMPEP_0203638600 /NCGR_PEP_ID=MMETSP0088-20131115/4583_1 /ASSEMBLY_ACC=CAM_ASM_001087 /TAXON_ID=426623 /ORGANISM="Chaetoceros affinis, Strain CCMP159" /LENGTH=730 /DNA_ID=CAMNT_0050493275 /DNA_START=199 /DNA_END=2391 /DNA_ORIENTATION=-